MNIRVADKEDAARLAEIIRTAYATVAARFGLTPENCPKHPSNCTPEWVQGDMDRGVVYYILESGSRAVGCAALEKANPETCYLERLAVIPEKRKAGLGHRLVDYFLKQAAAQGFRTVGIGIIAEQRDLKSWYQEQGFVETGKKSFAHLPFDVAFMERHIEKA